MGASLKVLSEVFGPGETVWENQRDEFIRLDPRKRLPDTVINDWRWLVMRSEQRLLVDNTQATADASEEILGEHCDIDQFACFVPRTILEAIADGRIRYGDDVDLIVDRFNAAVVFCDASGFTALTEALDREPNGSEKLGAGINNFFAPLIEIVTFWGGDVIKFSGDAVTIVWPADADEASLSESCQDTSTLEDGISSRTSLSRKDLAVSASPMNSSAAQIDEQHSFGPFTRDTARQFEETKQRRKGTWDSSKSTGLTRRDACRLACQCCLDLHSFLNDFPTPVPGRLFTLHIGVGYGQVSVLQVGGILDRWEYVVAGPPLKEIAIAEPLAASGETVISPSVIAAIDGVEGADLEFIEAAVPEYPLSASPPQSPLQHPKFESFVEPLAGPSDSSSTSVNPRGSNNSYQNTKMQFDQIPWFDVKVPENSGSPATSSSNATSSWDLIGGSFESIPRQNNGRKMPTDGAFRRPMPLPVSLFEKQRGNNNYSASTSSSGGLPRIYAKLRGMHQKKVRPPPKLAPLELQPEDAGLLKRFIPPVVFQRLTTGYNVFMNELRRVTSIFIGVRDLDISTVAGSKMIHKFMRAVQKVTYVLEGSINKLLVDDKGVLLLIIYGLPQGYHLDDPLRALMTALRVVDALKKLRLVGGLGIATGRVWCGTVGCDFRREYTAMGDTVNLSARLMGKAGENEINCDQETALLCEKVFNFTAMPPVQMKGKANLVPLYQPTGSMRKSAALRTTIGEPIKKWEGWKYKVKLRNLLAPNFEFRDPDPAHDVPPPDLPRPCGPGLPWEYNESWLPTLQPTAEVGGIGVIVGSEAHGITELVQFIIKTARQRKDRRVLHCSNMPDSTYMHIGNVPLLVWRKLCTEIVDIWRVKGDATLARGYNSSNSAALLTRDCSTFGLTKDLIHPDLHQHIYELKSVIDGLTLPYEIPTLRLSEKTGFFRPITGFLTPADVSDTISVESFHTADSAPSDTSSVSLLPLREALQQFSSHEIIPTTPPAHSPLLSIKPKEMARMCATLVNTFTSVEPTILVLHIYSGTSLSAASDPEPWMAASELARLAMARRRTKISNDMNALKLWRKRHSRGCLACRGLKKPFQKFNGDIVRPELTFGCRPPPSAYFPPLFLLVVCDEICESAAEQQDIVQWAKECAAYYPMKPLSPVETSSYLAHCLSVPPAALPFDLVDYTHRVSGGVPRYIHWTVQQLVFEKAISIESFPESEHRSTRSAAHEALKLADKTSLTDNHRADEEGDVFYGADSTMEGSSTVSNGEKSIFPTSGNLENATPPFASTYPKIKKRNNESRKNAGNTTNGKSPAYQQRQIPRKAASLVDPDIVVQREAFTHETRHSSRGVQRLCNFKYHTPLLDEFEERAFKVNAASRTESDGSQHPMNISNSGTENDFRCQDKLPGHALSNNGNKTSRGAMDSAALITISQETLVRVRVKTELHKVPFSNELRAAGISLMERLQPDEQLAAKVASLFPVPFTAFELHSACPRLIDAEHFRGIVDTLFRAELLENCAPPTDSELAEFGLLFTPDGGAGTDLQEGSINFIPTKSNGRKYSSILLPSDSQISNSEPLIENAAEIAKKSIESVQFCATSKRDDMSASDKTPIVLMTQIPRRTTSSATLDTVTSSENDDAVSLMSAIEPVQNNWGFDEDGNPVFYRFNSMAFQKIIADMLISAEKALLEEALREVILMRQEFGLQILIDRLNGFPAVEKPLSLSDPNHTMMALQSFQANRTGEHVQLLSFITQKSLRSSPVETDKPTDTRYSEESTYNGYEEDLIQPYRKSQSRSFWWQSRSASKAVLDRSTSGNLSNELIKRFGTQLSWLPQRP